MAALAGALNVMLYQDASGQFFPSFNSLTLVVLVVIITIGDPWYAVLAAVGYTVIPSYITGNTTTNVLNLLFGIGAVTAAYNARIAGAPMSMRRLLDRLGGRAPVPARSTVLSDIDLASLSSTPATSKPREGLVVRDLSVRFGGVHAVISVSFAAPMGRITGLIGPNGAGKTTTFNACGGFTRPSAGRVMLHGIDVTRQGPSRRARLGMGRTFQRTELFDSLTVRQNVAMGREASIAGANALGHIAGSRASKQLVNDAVDDALALTGLQPIADEQVGPLPIGQRRLVELARILAGPFDLLLLDEPSSGLDGRETEQFGTVLRAVVRTRRLGILLVEHDMSLVRAICDRVYVLDFGQLIFEGTVDEMQESPLVREAYLGGLNAPVDASDIERD